MRRATIWKAELLRALRGVGWKPGQDDTPSGGLDPSLGQLVQSVAELLGFRAPDILAPDSNGGDDGGDLDPPPPLRPENLEARFAPVPFSMPVSLVPAEQEGAAPERVERTELSEDELDGKGADGKASHRTHIPPKVREEVPFDRIWARLQQALGQHQESTRVDVAECVNRLAQLHIPDPLPRRTIVRQGMKILLVIDRSETMGPIHRDQDDVGFGLAGLLPPGHLKLHQLRQGLTGLEREQLFKRLVEESERDDWSVLILGDLGYSNGPRSQGRWEILGRDLQRLRIPVCCLSPFHEDFATTDQRKLFHMLPWDPAPDRVEYPEAIGDLAAWLSVCERVDPGLMRQVRRTLDLPGTSMASEIRLWRPCQYTWDAVSIGWTASGDRLDRLKEILAEPTPDQCARVRSWLKVLRCWHACLPPELWNLCVLNLEYALPICLQEAIERDLKEAKDWLRRWNGTAHADNSGGRGVCARFFDVVEQRSTLGLSHSPEAMALRIHYRGREKLDDIPDREESFWHQVQALLPSETLEGRGILMQGSDGLNYQEPKQEIPGKAQSPLMPLETRGGALLRDGGTFQSWLPPSARLDNRTDPWAGSVHSVAGTTHIEPTSRPEWADAMGRDRFGLWVEVIFKGVTQRMRWIPPGRFLMGAAKDEPEADADAKPQHWVTLTQGYWLADTPCTQELWHAVMNEDPSHFKGTALPVESVTFERVEQFCRELTEPDGSSPSEENGYRLPTEAQWEYACRAGGHDETYNRPWEAGALDQIAWYANSPGDKTQPVKGKRCNCWGLHDMLGNVWELCSDMNEPYKAEAQIDPIGKGSERVYRGGSCWVVAGNVRPAYRLWWFDEHVAFRGLGFRLSRGHAAQDRSGIGGADGA